MKISNNDLQRYSKQIILKNIGIIGQKRILKSKVAIIGIGGLGCPLVLYLANSGVGNIGLIDHDKIDLSNLNRQILFNTTDVGKYKVKEAKKKINEINKNIKVKIFKEKLTKKNIKNILSKFDIICDGTDNYESRYLINDYCLKHKKILISAAISKFEGQVFNFNFKRNIPCFRCFMPEVPDEDNNCETAGIVPSLAGITGTLQANEVLKTILKTKNDLVGKILIFNLLTLHFRKIKLTKDINCIKECIKK
ncbi:HesA/MoeB/ThiF family protein [Pelagibacteraceae bacterium]|jgi:molybdopterin/thiamine biosynthesis adenylyltransferase|nr:HesA/MoeB/ThiF family protein [Pelagibacteraceae bacterium]|tara:strand:+ start:167 stop:919 length:753 start_codon:yes stop_codon:yes gene_type:complete